MKHIYFLILFLTPVLLLHAQTDDFQPDITRGLFHYKVDAAQKKLLAMDGRSDDSIIVDDDEEVNMQLTYQATVRINKLQKEIEFNASIDHQHKVIYLRGLTDLINGFTGELIQRRMTWNQLPMLMNGFEDALQLHIRGLSLVPAIKNCNYAIGSMLINNFAFKDNPGLPEIKEVLFLKYLGSHPGNILRELSKESDFAFTDSLIRMVAKVAPEELFSYAQGRKTDLGKKIAEVAQTDSLVKLIVDLSSQNSGQMYFPFLDQMNSKELLWEDIAKALEDSSAYYKLLVKTQIRNAERMTKGDTPVATRGLQDMLRQKSYELYVNVINGLHDEPAAIRFRIIQKLTPEELYYLVVMNETTIYTSSYIYVYNRIFEKMPVKSSDTLLQLVNHDRYKKFLTMASNYNTLDDFLGKMNKGSATALMSDFVSNLDKGKTNEDIEDAVDVANAYASIKKPAIRKLMLDQVNKNFEAAAFEYNRKGMIIYHLEKMIMESNDSKTPINISDSLGIPPVYEVKNRYLRDTMGRIIMQMFFYGDEGGKGSFRALMGLYSDRKKWAMTSTAEWVQFTSIKTPVPFILFANRALDEEQDLDEQAQNDLIEYMEDSGFMPSITVHRGHSYFLKYTIEKMLPSSKVVVLGSCGAYQNLAQILKISPDAYIISSKQVGYGEINIALFSYLIENLKAGKDIKWPVMMSDVGKRISGAKQEGFDDYVFPHKNLGALFIKAYKIASQKDAETFGLSKL